ncbi:unnamed protein product [Discosporangium mesarthrocarpum]
MVERQPCSYNIVWVRYEGDFGLWWPGVEIGTAEESDFVLKGLRDSMHAQGKAVPQGGGSLFLLLHAEKIIEGSNSRPFSRFNGRKQNCKGAPERIIKDLNQVVEKVMRLLKNSTRKWGRGAAGFQSFKESCTPGTPADITCGSECRTSPTASTTPDACCGWSDSSQSEGEQSPSSNSAEIEHCSAQPASQQGMFHTDVFLQRSQLPPQVHPSSGRPNQSDSASLNDILDEKSMRTRGRAAADPICLSQGRLTRRPTHGDQVIQAGTKRLREDQQEEAEGPARSGRTLLDVEAQKIKETTTSSDAPGWSGMQQLKKLRRPLDGLSQMPSLEDGKTDLRLYQGGENDTGGSSAREREQQEGIQGESLDEVLELQAVNITGEEGFAELFPKLKEVGWRWGPQVSQLDSRWTVLKPGAQAKTSILGVDRFMKAGVVHYVQKLLGQSCDGQVLDDEGEWCKPEQYTGPSENNARGETRLGRPRNVAALDRAEAGQTPAKDPSCSPCRGGRVRKRATPEGISAKPISNPERGSRERNLDGVNETNMEEELCAHNKEETGLLQDHESQEARKLNQALEALHPHRTPGPLRQRTAEIQKILDIVTCSVKEAIGGSVYLCGCPGTGKTQSMAHVQAHLAEAAQEENFPPPIFHTLKGTSFTEPTAMYSALWQVVAGNEPAPSHRIEKLLGSKLTRTSKPSRASPMIVLVVDEIDLLLSQDRQVLLKLFDWAHGPKSRLQVTLQSHFFEAILFHSFALILVYSPFVFKVLVGIANSIEFDVHFVDRHHLFERKPEKVLFRAYSPKELNEILTERVGGIVEAGAINFCSKKVAASSGDARRAISLCREAVSLAKEEWDTKECDGVSAKVGGEQEIISAQQGPALVTIAHMAKAVRAGNMSNYEDVISSLAPQAQVVLCVAAAMVGGPTEENEMSRGRSTDRVEPLEQGRLHERCKLLWSKSRLGGVLSQIEFSALVDNLSAQGLLGVKCKQRSRTVGRARRLTLQIEFTDVQAALGDQPFFRIATAQSIR